MEKPNRGNAYPFRRWLAAAALALVSLNASAIVWNSNTDFHWNAKTGGITVFPGPGSGNVWSTATASPGANGPEFKFGPKPLPFNPSPKADFTAKFNYGDMAKRVARPLAPLIVTYALGELLKQACVRVAGGEMSIAPGGQWEECHMVPTPTKQYTYNNPANNNSGGPWFDSYTSAGQEWVTLNLKDGYDGCTGYKNILFFETYVQYDIYNKYGYCYGYPQGYVRQSGAKQSIWSKTMDKDVQDGWQASDASKAEAAITAKMGQWTQADFTYGYKPDVPNTRDIMNDLINSNNGISPDSVSGTGPATQTGTPTVTTTQNPDGTTTTTTTNVTNNYTYAGSSCTGTGSCTVTITNNQTTTSTTTVTNASGGTVSTSTTTTTGKGGEPEDPNKCPEGTDKPSCADRGEPPEDKIPTNTKDVSFQEEQFGWGGGTCPAPYTWSDKLGTHRIDLGTFCAKLTNVVRPVVLVLAALIALGIAVPGIREG